MNIYSTAIISTGLSLILINSYSRTVFAKEVLEHPTTDCNQIESKAFAPTKTIPAIDDSSESSLVASTDSTPSDSTQSSFWWAALQFDPFGGKLVQNWLTYPHKQQINLVVNWRLWTLLDYFGRYRFVNQFGTVARKHGYSLNIFNQKDQCLASYKYNAHSIPPKWELNLEESGRTSLPIEPAVQQQYLIPAGQ